MFSSPGLKLWFIHDCIARKSVNSVLDPVRDLEIQDRTLVDLKHLTETPGPVTLSGHPTASRPEFTQRFPVQLVPS